MSAKPENEFVTSEQKYRLAKPYLQNRELSWLTFDERVLDQGADENVPLLERLNFVSIFWSNLQEFFMVRVGSLTDLTYVKPPIIDNKSGLTPREQIDAIHERLRELYPRQQQVYEDLRKKLALEGVRNLHVSELSEEQLEFVRQYAKTSIIPFLSPQIVNSRHPFPHLENGALYVTVRLDETADEAHVADAHATDDHGKKKKKKDKGKGKKGGAEGVTLGFIPMPKQCPRVIGIPGEGFNYILLEEAVEEVADEVFSMYKVKHTNIICVTRNADLDTQEGSEESDVDYREFMKRILKKRGRLAPVRLESNKPLSPAVSKELLTQLDLRPDQAYVTSVPLDLSFTWGLPSNLSQDKRTPLVNSLFHPAWTASFKPNKSIMKQVTKKGTVLLSYPYESMDPFVKMLEEAAVDPDVLSIRITLYRLASVSRLAEALIRAAENGKEVTALFELRARFDESNNIKWSQEFEESGCNVIYGFRDYKVHSKICSITKRTDNGMQFITQLGTGNYNEKTAKLYTDFSYITTNTEIGLDAVEFFRNMQLENASDAYKTLWVAPLQIKQNILAGIDGEIAKAQAGKPCGLFFKTNSVTDREVIEKLTEASQAGVPITLFVRGISCIVPNVKGFTDNVRVVSIVGRLLEHSRIYIFGALDDEDVRLYCSSADLMTRNMDKRVEIAWPISEPNHRQRILDYLYACMHDTAKLRELNADGAYTAIGALAKPGADLFDSQNWNIELAKMAFNDQIAASRSLQGKPAEEASAGPVSKKPTKEAEHPETVTEFTNVPKPEPKPEPEAEPEIVIEPKAATALKDETTPGTPDTPPAAGKPKVAVTQTKPESASKRQTNIVQFPKGKKPNPTSALDVLRTVAKGTRKLWHNRKK